MQHFRDLQKRTITDHESKEDRVWGSRSQVAIANSVNGIIDDDLNEIIGSSVGIADRTYMLYYLQHMLQVQHGTA